MLDIFIQAEIFIELPVIGYLERNGTNKFSPLRGPILNKNFIAEILNHLIKPEGIAVCRYKPSGRVGKYPCL